VNTKTNCTLTRY